MTGRFSDSVIGDQHHGLLRYGQIHSIHRLLKRMSTILHQKSSGDGESEGPNQDQDRIRGTKDTTTKNLYGDIHGQTQEGNGKRNSKPSIGLNIVTH